MCRLVGWVSSEPVTMRELLGDAAVERLLYLSAVHCHGWGAAWREDASLIVRRSQTQASNDPDFLEVIDSLRTTAAIVHLRLGTPGFDRQLDDTHPFTDGTWALAHNGAVAPSDRVDALLPQDSPLIPQGTTDSERWFLALLHEFERTDERPEAHDRLAAAVAAVVDRAERSGLRCSSWNSLLLGPHALYVVNHHDAAWQPGSIPVWPDSPPDEASCWPPYFDLRMRESDGARLVVSSGVVDDPDGWELLPNASVLRLDFSTGGSQHAEIAVPASRS